MATVTLQVCSLDDTKRRLLHASKGAPQGSFISFESPQQLFKVLSGKRWDILKVLTGAGPLTLREVARRVSRDVKGVHSDVHVLLNSGILRKSDTGRLVFPYEAIHVDFLVKAA
jgi:predicted transcriptional regulator